MKAVVYLRVSTREQGDSKLGIEAQRAAVAAYATSVGAEIIAEHVEVESGRKASRPVLAAAMAECRRSKATLLIAKLDRLARNVAFVAGLIESGVAFVAVDRPNATPMELHIYATFAQHEAEQTAQRTKAALAALKARGQSLGNPSGAAAIPVAIAGKQRLAAEYAAKVKPEAERLRKRNYTLQQIADYLTARGILTRTAKRWTPTAVMRLLAC